MREEGETSLKESWGWSDVTGSFTGVLSEGMDSFIPAKHLCIASIAGQRDATVPSSEGVVIAGKGDSNKQ